MLSGRWTRFVLWLHGRRANARVITDNTIMRRVRQRIIHDAAEHAAKHKYKFVEEPAFTGSVDWSKRCTCGTRMRSTSHDRICYACQQRARERVERERFIFELHQKFLQRRMTVLVARR